MNVNNITIDGNTSLIIAAGYGNETIINILHGLILKWDTDKSTCN